MMRAFRRARIILVITSSCLLAACAAEVARDRAGPASAPPRGEMPVPAHAVAPINRGLATGEAVWHLRAGLNVAALVCREPSHAQLTPSYNRMLQLHRTGLAEAYAEEQSRFRAAAGAAWQDRMDSHLTSLYNFFANPVAQKRFCATAVRVVNRVNGLSGAGLREYVQAGLAELEHPIVSGGALARR